MPKQNLFTNWQCMKYKNFHSWFPMTIMQIHMEYAELLVLSQGKHYWDSFSHASCHWFKREKKKEKLEMKKDITYFISIPKCINVRKLLQIRLILFALSQWYIKKRSQFVWLIFLWESYLLIANFWHPHSDIRYNIKLNHACHWYEEDK